MLVAKQLPVAIDFYSILSSLMEVNGYQQMFGYRHSSKTFFCVQLKERNSYRFGTTWGRVNDDRVWTIPLKDHILHFCTIIYKFSPLIMLVFFLY